MPLMPPPTTITSPRFSTAGPRERCATISCACATDWCPRQASRLNGVPDDFRDVPDLDHITVYAVQPAILEIGDAIRAGCRQNLGPDADSLFQPKVGESLALRGFHPDPAAPAAAAETVLARLGHLVEFQAGYLLQRFPGLVIDAVVPAQVTRVVVSHGLAIFLREFEPALGNQAEDELRHVNHFEVHHEFGIFVLEGVIAVRLRHQDF